MTMNLRQLLFTLFGILLMAEAFTQSGQIQVSVTVQQNELI